MKLYYTSEKIYFKRPFKIAHGERTFTPIVLIQLHFNGIVGYGEASLPPYLIETQESVQLFFEKAKKILECIEISFDIDSLLEQIDEIEENNTAAKAAID